ncbi:DUF2391 family protein [Aquifex sp.]
MDRLNEINKKVDNLEKKITEMYEDFENSRKKQKLGFSDLVQELIGAMIIALPFSLTEEVWEISERLSFFRILIVYLITVFTVFLFIKYSKLQNWEQQNVLGFIPLRLITSLSISFFISLLFLTLFGVYPDMIKDLSTLLKASLLVSIFAVIGSLGVDVAK